MLKDQIKDDLTRYMKEGDEIGRSVLRMLSAAILNKEKEKRFKISKSDPQATEEIIQEKARLTDEEIIDVVSSEIKKRRESALEFKKGKREELAEKELKEVDFLMKYLPAQISEDEVSKIVKEALIKTGAKSLKEMGKVMAEIMPKVKGKADSGLVSEIVKKNLSA